MICEPSTGFTCAWCGPTWFELASPAASTGGAASSSASIVPSVVLATRFSAPWQLVQVSVAGSYCPFRCAAGTTQLARFPVVQLYPVWQSWQFFVAVTPECAAVEGGALWHVPHPAPVDPWFHVGVGDDPM
jgi:hypothetical protein